MKAIRVLMYTVISVMIASIGYGIGSADKCTDWYQQGIEDTKLEMQAAIEKGVPFNFGNIKFIPRKDGAVDARAGRKGNVMKKTIKAKTAEAKQPTSCAQFCKVHNDIIDNSVCEVRQIRYPAICRECLQYRG